MQHCRRCEQLLPFTHFYTQPRNKTGFEYTCKRCKSITVASRRYQIDESLAEWLYSHDACMACGSQFGGRNGHIHQTFDGVHGILCFICHQMLGQENSLDLQRLQYCLWFAQLPRKNLSDRVNPQGRPESVVSRRHTSEPSETTRCGPSRLCKHCNNELPLESFSYEKARSYRSVCYDCALANTRLLSSSRLKHLRTALFCECCGENFTKYNRLCIHHIGVNVLGVVCSRCNHVLGDESTEHLRKVRSCIDWVTCRESNRVMI